MKPAMTGKENYRRNQVSSALKRSASLRQCPECSRKGALKHMVDGDFAVTYCRYCDYERGSYL